MSANVLQQASCRGPRFLADIHAAEHARQFFLALAGREDGDGALGHTGALSLADAVVRVALRRNLRQVGHAQRLSRCAQRTQLLPDDVGHRAADARIDFVEHHGGYGIRAQRRHLDRERNA